MIFLSWYLLNKTARGQELAVRIGAELLTVFRSLR